MSDPRLNSVHLPAARRQQFRAARSSLLGTTGNATLVGEQLPEGKAPAEDQTLIHAGDKQLPVGVKFVLIDNDFVHPLKVGINTVGRMPDNDVVVADPYVSRRHIAIVIHAHGGCELHDVASKNGTVVNGKTISGSIPLKSGDQIHLSDHLLVFLSNAGSNGSGPKTEITNCE